MDLRKQILQNAPNRLYNPATSLVPPATYSRDPKDRYEETSWDQYYDNREVLDNGLCVYRAGTKGPFVLFLHGAGHTALSWALVAKSLKTTCRVISYDFRGHGESTADDADLSSDVLVKDTAGIIAAEVPEGEKVVIVGHSMGGAMAIRTATAIGPTKIRALVVVDVVEGTAMEALPKMQILLATRPKSFESTSEAIRWASATGEMRNVTAASVAIPSQLRKTEEGTYVWRTNLEKTSQFWKGWFESLSKLFLGCVGAKLLLLANTNRLDTELTIAQMQGKFQMIVLSNVGHTLQADDPTRTSEALVTFLTRNGAFK
eukprot:TRINITY_DN4439_c0_g1_i1.p1 TRINITY_DN4439_c0_g1~~TRINITY_DN4439_c0_g1_i1.p1  ORF type:complete len:317 (+),score=51.87 TRINITY_DN4439_c0_g1_i1:669-1619(+)